MGTLEFEAAPPVPPTPATKEYLYTVMEGSVYEIADGKATKVYTLADDTDMLGAMGKQMKKVSAMIQAYLNQAHNTDHVINQIKELIS